uniref:Major facilitator superfamily (MFS) profile domain-containing protein n=1 Tax=Hucho hucho TaxID=62062 RepID=A0A4W5K7S3_9TELE
MAILQKHGKISGPDLVCLKETPSDKLGDAGGHQKNWSEQNTNWPRPLARVWTVVLLLGTCLLYCARVAMPICAVSMAEKFNWTKREQGMVLGSFFWGYCFTQVLGGYVSDRWATRGDDYKSYCLFAHKFAHKLPVCQACHIC